MLNLATYDSVSTDGERLTDPCVAEMFLDFEQRRGHGISARRYVSQVLDPIVLSFIAAHQVTVWQQDDAQPHAAKLTIELLRNKMSRNYDGLRYHPILARLKFV